MIQLLLSLLVLVNPKIQLIVLRILRNLVTINTPHEVFEEAIHQLKKDESDATFVGFLYSYLKEQITKVWNTTEAACKQD